MRNSNEEHPGLKESGYKGNVSANESKIVCFDALSISPPTHYHNDPLAVKRQDGHKERWW